MIINILQVIFYPLNNSITFIYLNAELILDDFSKATQIQMVKAGYLCKELWYYLGDLQIYPEYSMNIRKMSFSKALISKFLALCLIFI